MSPEITPPHHKSLLKGLSTFVLIVLPVLCLLGALEGVARLFEVWRPPMTEDIGQGFTAESRLFLPSETDPNLLVTNPRKTVSFREQSFSRTRPAAFSAFLHWAGHR